MRKKQQQYAHTESVAGLDNSENWSKKIQKNNTRTTKVLLDQSIVRISLKTIIQLNKKQQHAHTKNVARLVDSGNWSKLFLI